MAGSKPRPLTATQREKASHRYLAAVEDFQTWCAGRGLPFKWAMAQAMQLYRDLWTPEMEEEVSDAQSE